jgi:hypothetical protein
MDWMKKTIRILTLRFSPSIIAGSQLIFSAINSTEIGKLDFAFISKYQ